MDHADARAHGQRHPAAPTPRPQADRSGDAELLELQRTAGNRAVTEAITTVQRHRLNPENIDELPSA